MAKVFGKAPFPPEVTLDFNRPISWNDLRAALTSRSKGVTFCVRYGDGPPQRGGYFFHVRTSKSDGKKWSLFDFEKNLIADEIESERLVRLMNHCTGRQFDDDSFQLSASINFKVDN